MTQDGSRPTPSDARPAFAPWRWAERVTEAVESLSALDELVKPVTSSFSRVVRPGRVKDALSGTCMGHPAHPMLTDIPIGAWASAFLLDLMGGEERHVAADSLIGAGVVMAVPTALTGLSDLADVEDKERRAVGAAHALGNVAVLTLYAGSYVMRKRDRRRAGFVLSALGAALMAGSSFLGGHLSYRKGVGVDTTAFDDAPATWTPVLDEGELKPGTARRVRIGRTDVLLYGDGDRIHALANRCTHRGGPLHKGRIQGGEVRCPWHHSTFRLDDGSIIQGPATAPQPRFEARRSSGKIEVRRAD